MEQQQSKTAKSKLDAALGIAPDKSIDDFLNSLSIENDSAKQAVDKIDDSIKQEVANIDKEMQVVSISNEDYDKKAMSLANIEVSFKNIDDLIAISKDVIKHVYENITCTELVDSEMIHAAAAFIESCHLNVKEYIDLYKDRLKFYDKLRIEMVQQQHKIELLREKHKLDMEKLNSKTIDTVPEGMVTFDLGSITDALKDQAL